MASEVFMPKLGPSMESGIILKWFKEEGDPISKGEMLYEVMTDKVNIEIESDTSGILLKKLFEEDEEVPVNQSIAYIGEEGETIEEVNNSTDDNMQRENTTNIRPVNNTESEKNLKIVPKKSEKKRATPAARRLARDNNIDLNLINGSGPKERVQLRDVKGYLESENSISNITPLAMKISEKENVHLSDIKGKGKTNKIKSKDIYKHLDQEKNIPFERNGMKIKVRGMRKIIAERMVESAFKAPHATISTEIDMTLAKKMREELLPIISEKTGYRLSYTEIIMKATAKTLEKHPIINSSLVDDHILVHSEINIGLAVDVEGGLLVPVIRNCNTKNLTELTKESKTLGHLARNNELDINEMSDGTFTISNLGMYAIDNFSPIINQPESAILGVGRIVEKPVGIDGVVCLKPMMALSLSFDHRVINGAPASAFLTELKETIENPLMMLT